jgi:hypothetical protein
MNEEQIRRLTVQLVNQLVEYSATMPEFIAGCFEPKLLPEDAVRVGYQLANVRVALPRPS